MVIMQTRREGYTPNQCGHTLTVNELIEYLSQFDGGAEVYTSHDDGYTYGSIKWQDMDEEFDEE